MTILEQLPQAARVAVIRLRSLADCVLVTPAVALLKAARADLQIGLAVEDRFAPALEGSPVIDRVLPATVQGIRRWKPNVCVNLHGGAKSQWMTALSGAKWRVGFTHHSFTFAYNVKVGRAQRILAVNRAVHIAEHLASAFFAFGVPLADVPRAQLGAGESPIAGRYAALQPFAASADRQWPAERFRELARYLDLWNIAPVFLLAPGQDAGVFAPHRVFTGTLRDHKAALSQASVAIGTDYGATQMAAAFGVPCVLLGGGNPASCGPWRTEAEVVAAPEGVPALNVSRVVAALERLRIFEEAHA